MAATSTAQPAAQIAAIQAALASDQWSLGLETSNFLAPYMQSPFQHPRLDCTLNQLGLITLIRTLTIDLVYHVDVRNTQVHNWLSLPPPCNGAFYQGHSFNSLKDWFRHTYIHTYIDNWFSPTLLAKWACFQGHGLEGVVYQVRSCQDSICLSTKWHLAIRPLLPAYFEHQETRGNTIVRLWNPQTP